MRDHALFDKIDLHLIRVLHTVLTERSVSRAAVRLGMHQPAVSAALKRLRDLAGDPLLDEDYLVLSTVHSAKGQEWEAVHVLNVTDGSFPSEFSAALGSTAGAPTETEPPHAGCVPCCRPPIPSDGLGNPTVA